MEKGNFIKRIIGGIKERFGPTTYTAPVATSTPTYKIPDRGVELTDKDISELRNVLFGEVSNRDPERQAFEARIITNTALNRIPQYAEKKKNMNLASVLAQPNQYQAYGGKEYNRLIKNATTTANPMDQQKLKAIDDVISELKSGNFQDTTDGKVFYVHDPQGRIWLKDGGLYK